MSKGRNRIALPQSSSSSFPPWVDLPPLFHLPLYLMTCCPLLLCLSDVLTGIPARCVLLICGQTINSRFTAIFPLLLLLCQESVEYLQQPLESLLTEKQTNWSWFSEEHVSENGREELFLSDLLFYCWLDRAFCQASTHLVIYPSIHPFI